MGNFELVEEHLETIYREWCEGRLKPLSKRSERSQARPTPSDITPRTVWISIMTQTKKGEVQVKQIVLRNDQVDQQHYIRLVYYATGNKYEAAASVRKEHLTEEHLATRARGAPPPLG